MLTATFELRADALVRSEKRALHVSLAIFTIALIVWAYFFGDQIRLLRGYGVSGDDLVATMACPLLVLVAFAVASSWTNLARRLSGRRETEAFQRAMTRRESDLIRSGVAESIAVATIVRAIAMRLNAANQRVRPSARLGRKAQWYCELGEAYVERLRALDLSDDESSLAHISAMNAVIQFKKAEREAMRLRAARVGPSI